MAAARRQLCDYPGCAGGTPDDNGIPQPYITEEGLARRDEVAADLKEHVRRAHELPQELAKLEVEKIRAEAEKLKYEAERLRAERPPSSPSDSVTTPREVVDKRATIPRPEIDEGVNESDWSFFTAQWARYRDSTKLSGVTETQHLWAACSQVLQRSLHNGGAGAVTDPKELIERIKELAVKKRNNLVNIIE